jgi:dolichyl-phosphate beta-glucosyltransferase
LKFSIVIPAYNEEERIGPSIEAILAYFPGVLPDFELVLVDDGSNDATVSLVESYRDRLPALQILENPVNLGKGGAIKRGMLAAKGDYVLFCDADQSTPFSEMDKFLGAIKAGEDVIIGTRKSPEARIEKHQPWLRESLGKGFTWLSHLLIGVQVSDFTCGFKVFSRRAVEEIFTRQRIFDWSFDSEILFIAQRRGLQIREIPVTWSNSAATKVNLWRDVWGSFRGLLRIREYARRGVYDGEQPKRGEHDG